MQRAAGPAQVRCKGTLTLTTGEQTPANVPGTYCSQTTPPQLPVPGPCRSKRCAPVLLHVISMQHYMDIDGCDTPSGGPAVQLSSDSEREPTHSDRSGDSSLCPADNLDEQLHHEEKKYIVFISFLKTLMMWYHCPSCKNSRKCYVR